MRDMNRNYPFWQAVTRRFVAGLVIGILLGQLGQLGQTLGTASHSLLNRFAAQGVIVQAAGGLDCGDIKFLAQRSLIYHGSELLFAFSGDIAMNVSPSGSVASAASGAASQASTGDAVAITVLKKALDIEAQGALQLIQALPATPSNPPNLGNGVDTFA